uniref:Uncharacterized protein n=1 Tax=Timema tahoe TaxID=61484 RepID=A0A7R9IGP0_9NEOP|nr:unnamed protein product [Timema tahoe]
MSLKLRGGNAFTHSVSDSVWSRDVSVTNPYRLKNLTLFSSPLLLPHGTAARHYFAGGGISCCSALPTVEYTRIPLDTLSSQAFPSFVFLLLASVSYLDRHFSAPYFLNHLLERVRCRLAKVILGMETLHAYIHNLTLSECEKQRGEGTLRSEKLKTEEEIFNMKEHIHTLTKVKEDQRTKIDSLEKCIEELKHTSEEAAETLNMYLEQTRNENSHLTKQNKDLIIDSQKKAEAEEILKKKISSLQDDLDEVTALEAKIEASQLEQKTLLERCFSSTSTCDNLQRTVNEIRRRLEESQAALHEMGRENQNLQALTDEMRTLSKRNEHKHLGDAAHGDAENLMANIRDTAKTPAIHQLVSWLQSRVELVKVSLQNYPGLPKTNNNIEGWHRGLQQHISASHPNIWKFVSAIKMEQSLNEVRIEQYTSGQKPSRRPIEADKIIYIQRGHSARFGAAWVRKSGHRVFVLEGKRCDQSRSSRQIFATSAMTALLAANNHHSSANKHSISRVFTVLIVSRS